MNGMFHKSLLHRPVTRSGAMLASTPAAVRVVQSGSAVPVWAASVTAPSLSVNLRMVEQPEPFTDGVPARLDIGRSVDVRHHNPCKVEDTRRDAQNRQFLGRHPPTHVVVPDDLEQHRVTGVEVEIRVLVEPEPSRDPADRTAGLHIPGSHRDMVQPGGVRMADDPSLQDGGYVRERSDVLQLGDLAALHEPPFYQGAPHDGEHLGGDVPLRPHVSLMTLRTARWRRARRRAPRQGGSPNAQVLLSRGQGRELLELAFPFGLERLEGGDRDEVAVALLAVRQLAGLDQPGQVGAGHAEEVGGLRGGQHRVAASGEGVHDLVQRLKRVGRQIDRLGANYGVTARWNNAPVEEEPPYATDPQPMPVPKIGRTQPVGQTVGLSGTYELDRARSESVDDIMTIPFSPEELLARVLVITRRALSAMTAEVPIRLCQLLLDFADGNAEDGDGFAPLGHHLTHETMSQIIGASRPHTSTVLGSLEEFGAVRRKTARGLTVHRGRLRGILASEGEENGRQPSVASPRTTSSLQTLCSSSRDS